MLLNVTFNDEVLVVTKIVVIDSHFSCRHSDFIDNFDGNVNVDGYPGKKWILKEKLKFFAETL